MTEQPPRFVPPTPPRPTAPLGLRAFLRTIRQNALMIWPDTAYRADITVRRFLGRTNFLLNAPEAVQHVLVTNAANYRRTPASIRILRPITGKGLLLSEGESWRLQRRTIAPALAPRVLPTLSPHIARAAAETRAVLAAQAQGPVDLLAAMQSLALSIAGRTMFSMEMATHGAAMRRMLTEFAQNYARPRLFDLILPPSVPTLRDIGRRRFQTRWMALISAIMAPRLVAPPPEEPRDLFDLLRAARDPETGAAFTETELRDQVATLILAGHETTAVTLFWALTLLAQSPAHQALVAREVAALDLSPDRAHASLAAMPYTRAVINETLRLFPPAFTIVREARGADILREARGADILRDEGGSDSVPDAGGSDSVRDAGGSDSGRKAPGSDSVVDHMVRRLDVMMIAPWILHRHHAFWTDPDAFDPSRFLPGAEPPPRFAYLPFGAGPRVCVGAQFALTEAAIALASLMQGFEVALADDRPVLPVAIVTTQPDHPPPFRLRPR